MSAMEISRRVNRTSLMLCWALCALYWQSKGKYSGATYSRLYKLLGLADMSTLRRTVKAAQEEGLVEVSYRRPADRWGGIVRLKKTTLKEMERLTWTV